MGIIENTRNALAGMQAHNQAIEVLTKNQYPEPNPTRKELEESPNGNIKKSLETSSDHAKDDYEMDIERIALAVHANIGGSSPGSLDPNQVIRALPGIIHNTLSDVDPGVKVSVLAQDSPPPTPSERGTRESSIRSLGFDFECAECGQGFSTYPDFLIHRDQSIACQNAITKYKGATLINSGPIDRATENLETATRGFIDTYLRERNRAYATEHPEVYGVKHDDEKARWDLLPWREVRQVVDVLTYGAKKYAPENWKKVPDAENRYFSAAIRHLAAAREGERLDPETKIPHLAHAACNLLFMAWFENERTKISFLKR